MKLAAILIAVIALAILISIFDSRRRARKIEAAFSGREPLNPESFYERYYKSRGVPRHVVTGVRAVLETQLRADLSRISANDDFSRNLSFFWDYDSMADVEIVCALEERFNITISDTEAVSCKTVDDIIMLVLSKRKAVELD